MDKNRDDIIRKLFERSLEPKERGELNNYEFINDALRKTMGKRHLPLLIR